MSFLFTSIRVYQSRNVNRLPSISKVIHDTLAFPDTPQKKVNFVLRSYVVVSSQFIADHAHFLGSNAFFRLFYLKERIFLKFLLKWWFLSRIKNFFFSFLLPWCWIRILLCYFGSETLEQQKCIDKLFCLSCYWRDRSKRTASSSRWTRKDGARLGDLLSFFFFFFFLKLLTLLILAAHTSL